MTLTFSQAEGLINELRGRLGQDDLTLAQTGGEGEVERTAASELKSRGWTLAPATTGGHDPAHDASAPSPPPERADGGRWAQEAHDEAAAERARRPRVPGS